MTDQSQKSSVAPLLYGVIVILLIAVGVLGYLQYEQYRADQIEAEDEIAFQKPKELTEDRLKRIVMRNCQLTPYLVDGTSMQPAYKNNSVHVFHTGVKCPLIALMKPGRVALLETGRIDKMAMKFVKGVPGDRFALARRPGRISVLTINGQDVKNSAGQSYRIERARQQLLDLYIRDYKGVIPQDSYLLLGDDPRGSLDSTQFGLVHINDIRGVMREEEKVEEPAPQPRPVAPVAAPVPAPNPAPVVEAAPEPTPAVELVVQQDSTPVSEEPEPASKPLVSAVDVPADAAEEVEEDVVSEDAPAGEAEPTDVAPEVEVETEEALLEE